MFPLSRLYCELLLQKNQRMGKLLPAAPTDSRKKPIVRNKSAPILLLISDPVTRDHLQTLLEENQFTPQLMADQDELLRVLKKNQFAIVLIDCGSVNIYGTRIISRIKVVGRHGRIIMFCDKAHLGDNQHRELIKEILKIGVYACILSPYKEWEVLYMVTYYSRLEKL